jgi:RES domain-containing protein
MALFDYLRETNRYHLPEYEQRLVSEMLDALESVALVTLPEGSRLFRARVHPPRKSQRELLPVHPPQPLPDNEIGAPPASLLSEGRLNPAGIRCLYLADSADTAVAEVRVFRGAIVTVGTFELTLDQHVLSFEESLLARIADNNVATNLSIVGKMLSRPHHYEDPLASIPTQFLASAIGARKHEGVRYESAARPGGVNTALFWPTIAKPVARSVGIVESISVRWSEA